MKSRLLNMIIAACTFTSLTVGNADEAATKEMTGKEIMQKQKKLQETSSEVVENVLILIDSKGQQETREIKKYSKDNSEGLNLSLTVFREPANIKGTALLTWEQKERDDDQWLYLPSQRKMQRIAGGSKKGYFMGTDFTYEDMEPEDIDEFNYTVLRTEQVEGKDCYVVEAVPATDEKKKKSGYGKRELWVRKDIFATVKIMFYDRRGRHLKTQTAHELYQVEGTVWRAKKALMDNKSREHKSVMGIKSLKINEDIPDSVFTERHILSGKHTD